MGYFKSDGNFIYLDAQYAEFYIPKYYFDERPVYAEEYGNKINVLGVFDVGIFEGGKIKEMRVLNIPSYIEIEATDIEERNVSLPGDENKTLCKVVKYQKGHKIMPSSIIQDSDNVQMYLRFVTSGKIPSIVPYEKSLQIWRKNQELNSTNLGVPSVIEELILSVAYRSKEDQSKKFAHVIGKDLNVSQFDYVMNNIRQICQYTSTFTALTFEDMDTMVTTSVNRTRGKIPETKSPVEDLIKL